MLAGRALCEMLSGSALQGLSAAVGDPNPLRLFAGSRLWPQKPKCPKGGVSYYGLGGV